MPLPIDVLQKYYNPYFVETGTHHGAGVYCAVNCNFQFIKSIEFDDRLYEKCACMFKPFGHVEIYNGSSSHQLRDMIKDVDEPATFWLDAHYSGNGTSFDEKYCPVLEELDQIAEHPIKTHTIMVDDRRLFGTTDDKAGIPFPEVTEQMIVDKMLSINSEYTISYESTEFVDDIIVAHV